MSLAPIVPVATRSSQQFSSLLGTVSDPDVEAVGNWSVRDVAAHVAGGLDAYLAILRGEGSPIVNLDEIAAYNARTVASVADRDLAALAARTEASFKRALAAADDRDATTPVAWHGGLRLPLATVWAVLAGEALVHGYDIARAARKPWPMPRDDVRTVLLNLLPLLPHFVDTSEAAGLHACVDLRLRGRRNGRALLVFEDGRLVVERENRRRVDCHISADPAAYLLVAYGRISPFRPALTGRIIAWGRKPHLAVRLSRLFRNP